MLHATKLFAVAGVTAVSTLAFAQAPAANPFPYQPTGQEITAAQAVTSLLTDVPNTVVFDHGKVFVQFNPPNAVPTTGSEQWASFADLATLKTQVETVAPVRTMKSDTTEYQLSWNRIRTSYTGQKDLFNAFDNLQPAADGSLTQDIPKTIDEQYQNLTSIFAYSVEPMTIIGHYVSVFKVASGFSGGAHDYIWAGFETIDADSFDKEPVSLINIVDNQDLLRALKADPYLKKVAQKANIVQSFNNVVQLTDFAALMAGTWATLDEPVSWKMDGLKQFEKFAIYDYDPKANLVTVRIGLEYNYEANRGAFEEVGIKVKPKPEFEATLRKVYGKPGAALFMKDVPNGKQPTISAGGVN